MVSWPEILFLLGFTLHNLEEALWLPSWPGISRHLKNPPDAGLFRFALTLVTLIGMVLTILSVPIREVPEITALLYFGFVGTMMVNALIPHLLLTLAERRYAPGTLTGVFLNIPLGYWVIRSRIPAGQVFWKFPVSVLAVSLSLLLMLKILFSLGRGKMKTGKA